MKYKSLILILICSLFLCGYEYKYKVPTLNAVNNATERNNMGIMYMEMGQYAAAMTEFQIAISLAPDVPTSATYYNNLGLLFVKLNQLNSAKECFERAIKLNPVFLEYYKNSVMVMQKQGTIGAELNKYLAQINADEDNSYAQLMAGLMYLQTGQKTNAKKHFKKFVKVEKLSVLSTGIHRIIKDLEKEGY